MKVLQLVFLFALTVVTSVHGRAIHRLRRSSYFANETACVVDDVAYYNGDPVPSSDPCEQCKCRTPGFVCTIRDCEEKDGCQRIKLPGECCSYKCDESVSEVVSKEDIISVPIRTTLLPEIISPSDIKEKDQEAIPHGEEGHVHHDKQEGHSHHAKEEEQTDHSKVERKHVSDADEPKSEVTTTAKPSDAPVVLLEDEKEQQEKKSEQQDLSQEEPKQIKRAEPTVIPDSSSSQESSSVPTSSEEPQSTIRQESHDSDKKLEDLSDQKKEGRSGTDQPQSEVSSPAPEKEAAPSSEKPEESSKDESKEEDQKDAHIPAQSGGVLFEKREEQQEPTREHGELLKPVSVVPSSSEGPEEEKETIKSVLPHEIPSEEKIEVVVVSTTPQADKEEVSEIIVGISEDEKKGKEKKEVDVISEEKQQEPSSSQLPPREDQQATTTTAASSSSTVDEAKELEKETVPPTKSGPSKRFADWVDYVPRDFQA